MGNAVVQLAGEEARNRKGKVFRKVCAQGQQEVRMYLESLEKALFAQRPEG